MLNNRNILCISGTEWHGNYIKAVVELMKVLSATNKVLFVDNAYTYKDAIAGVSDKNKVDFKKVFGFKSRITTIDTGNGGVVYLLSPPLVFPVSFLPAGFVYDTLLKFNGMVLRLATKKALRKLNMNHNLINFTSFNPGMGAVTGRKFGEKTLIYHCYDEIKGTAWWLRKHGLRLEQAFMKMVDVVIVTSKGLYNSKKENCRRCYIVHNAVKADLFKKGFTTEHKTGKTIIGYIGSVDDRLDMDILDYLFTSMPDAGFVFVGRIISERTGAALKKYDNVKLEGPKQPEELPAYLKRFFAGIIPFISDDFTKGIYPMKINEYLAAGLPVISTEFGDIAEFENVVKIARTKEEYLQYLLQEIETDTPEKRLARLAIAEGNTWQKRAEEISTVIKKVEAEINKA
jgi:glycosyltransferase involved in cell wall biosynthesis